MVVLSARPSGRDGRRRQVAAWMGAAVVYGAAQGLSTWVARYAQGRGTRPQYEQFERPAFAPPGAVFPVVWSALNLTTATSAWLVWRADEAGPGTPPRRAVLEWWALAVIVRSGYVPLAFGSRRLWAATADSALLCIVMVHYASLARRVDQTAAALAVPRNRVDRVRDRPERGGRRPKQLTGAPPANQVVSAIRTVRELTTGAGRSFRG
jgi:tryptophan-rich sensory protein